MKTLNTITLFLATLTGCNGYYGPMGGHHFGGYGGIPMFIFWVLIIGLIGLLVYFFFNKMGSSNETPIEILKKRYARGEISKDEFEEMKKNI